MKAMDEDMEVLMTTSESRRASRVAYVAVQAEHANSHCAFLGRGRILQVPVLRMVECRTCATLVVRNQGRAASWATDSTWRQPSKLQEAVVSVSADVGPPSHQQHSAYDLLFSQGVRGPPNTRGAQALLVLGGVDCWVNKRLHHRPIRLGVFWWWSLER